MSKDYADGDVIFDTQWRALKNAINGNGVLDPAPTLTPGGAMLVAVGSANVMRNKILTAIVPGSVTFTVAVAKSKWGAIWVPATGIPYMKMGIEADRPIMPEPNSWDDVLLGGVLIPLGMTVIAALDIIEMMFQTIIQHAQTTQQTANDHHNESHSHASHTGLTTDNHHAQIHGHADHTDRARRSNVNIMGGYWTSSNPTRGFCTTDGGNLNWGIGYITGVDSDWLYLHINTPEDAATTVFNLWISLINDATDTDGNVRFEIKYKNLRENQDSLEATIYKTATVKSAGYYWTNLGGMANSHLYGMQIRIKRLGTDILDTAGDCIIAGAFLAYTADM